MREDAVPAGRQRHGPHQGRFAIRPKRKALQCACKAEHQCCDPRTVSTGLEHTAGAWKSRSSQQQGRSTTPSRAGAHADVVWGRHLVHSAEAQHSLSGAHAPWVSKHVSSCFSETNQSAHAICGESSNGTYRNHCQAHRRPGWHARSGLACRVPPAAAGRLPCRAAGARRAGRRGRRARPRRPARTPAAPPSRRAPARPAGSPANFKCM